MAIIYTSRNLPGSYGGDYTNGNWGSLMNNYAVRFTPGLGGQGGGAFEGVNFTFSVSVYFPNSGIYVIKASADNSGSLNVGGYGMSVSGFSGESYNTRYFSRGTYTVSGSVTNAYNGPSYASNPYGIAFTIDAPPPPPAPSVSISVSPSSIINNGSNSATLSWSATGDVSSVSVTDVSSPGTSGSRTVQPTSTRTYTITACGEGGCNSSNTTLYVYQPPNLTLTLDRSSIAAGESTTLRWSTSGDASTITWTAGGITNGNLNSFATVAPTQSQTYSATVSGLGGSDSDSIRLTVYQLPTSTLTTPTSLDYGNQGVIDYQSCYSNTSLTLTPTYSYSNASGSSTVTGDAINLPTPNSAEEGVGTTCVSGTLNTTIPYTNAGPRSVTYSLVARGSGGERTVTNSVTINIDETPENINVPETDELFKEQEPIYTPDYTVTSNYLVVDDIDIPVEIKASRPIKVDRNRQDNWEDLRQI
jgi:hypothetical protein